jgi:hypothetical protein
MESPLRFETVFDGLFFGFFSVPAEEQQKNVAVMRNIGNIL